MASSVSTTASLTLAEPGMAMETAGGARPQADPLPSKRGEIGYVEGLHNAIEQPEANTSTFTLPARHPADRDASSSITTSGDRTATSPTSTHTSTPANADTPHASSDPSDSIHSISKHRLILFLTPKKIPTIGAWVVIIQRMQKDISNNGNVSSISQSSSQIFVHVAFGIATLAELVFVERCIFRLRAERYGYLHPGEVLPTSRRRAPDHAVGMGFAPWNRPSLPTYAAAIAQSGVGTGDVEDNAIAVPPPPAYGNTRGSTLLLAGFMTDALRSQRVRNSAATVLSRNTVMTEEDRPKSYMSQDPEWDERGRKRGPGAKLKSSDFFKVLAVTGHFSVQESFDVSRSTNH
ncbi:hypothetical protein A0H81_11155 [Grifola frondosa]|uniref:Uncharacterized protein n=1 Tax=Grifola frondosa TaxID=5627 RepID=A0A1C7LVB3_GRIFR|nr:hypothetical protein A0H81_11155 [Grifola frondosa]